MSEHARYSPSGAKKWMTCAGSPAMEHGQPDDSSEYADEGTAAHALASMCLTEGKNPDAYRGRKLHVVGGVYDPTYKHAVYAQGQKDLQGRIVREFVVDSDFASDVNIYVQHIRQCAEGNELHVEERVPIEHITGEKDAEGTADTVIFTTDSELQVHDLKFGRGVQVFAANNPQGMIYLLGALQKFEPIYGVPKRFRFVIHQPRLNHLDEWDCTHEELMAFADKATARAGEARDAFDTRKTWIGKQTANLVPGDHCKSAFCKARAVCPALAGYVSKTVGADFEVLGANVSVEQKEANIPDLPTDLADLGRKNAAVDIILDWCKQIRGKVEAALFENLNSAEAQAALGFKLVQGKKGDRAWRDADEAEALLKKMRLKTEEIYDFSVKTPPVLEKALKEQPKRWAKLTPLITQKDGQPSVTELADKRPALVIKPTADEFAAEDGSDLV